MQVHLEENKQTMDLKGRAFKKNFPPFHDDDINLTAKLPQKPCEYSLVLFSLK